MYHDYGAAHLPFLNFCKSSREKLISGMRTPVISAVTGI
jgi:hypothetical protein